MQLIPNRILETFALHYSIEGAYLLRYANLRSIGSFCFLHKKTKHFKNYFSSFLKNVEYRVVIKFLTRKGLNATDVSKELDSVYKNDAPSCRTVVK